MSDSDSKRATVLVSLPRPPCELPRSTPGAIRFGNLAAMIASQWTSDPPSHAWVRLILSTQVPFETFSKSYRALRAIGSAFKHRVIVAPVTVDHHTTDVSDLRRMANPETGQYEIEIDWRKVHVPGGTHFLLAVASDREDGSRERGAKQILDALESLLRVALGAFAVVDVRYTHHMEIPSGAHSDNSDPVVVFGEEECVRTSAEVLAGVVNMARAFEGAAESTSARLELGLHWLTRAFHANDLLAFWTALEVLADGRGVRVYRALAAAYGLKRSQAHQLAKGLGLEHIYDSRNRHAHAGQRAHVSPLGVSLILAIAHDLVGAALQLPSMRRAEAFMAGRTTSFDDMVKVG
jgi:hypothetical protein